MNFELNEDLREIQRMAKNFAENEIAPYVEEDEKNHHFRRETLMKMAELGFFGCVIPEEYGGTNFGYMASAIITEEIARVSASWGLPFNMQTTGPGLGILRWGTEEQKQEYIPQFVSCEKIACFAITEPDSGSDVVSMRTTAKEVDDGFILNGTKTWISNAHVADVGIVFALTDRSKGHKGMTAFIVDMKNTEGITTQAIETKLGLYCAPTGEISFEDAKVPKSAVLGEVGGGFKVCMTLLDNTRLSCATRAVGVARAALELSIDYAINRKQFGKRIADFQMVQSDLAMMHAEESAARLLVWKAASEKDKDRWTRNTLSVSTAKFYAAEAAVHATNLGMKIFGSYGFSTEYPMERFFRDSKSFQVVEGTHNIQKIIIASQIIPKD